MRIKDSIDSYELKFDEYDSDILRQFVDAKILEIKAFARLENK